MAVAEQGLWAQCGHIDRRQRGVVGRNLTQSSWSNTPNFTESIQDVLILLRKTAVWTTVQNCG